MPRLTKAELTDIEEWASDIHREADAWADRMDPQRKKVGGPLCAKIDALARIANDVRWHANIERGGSGL